MARIQMSNSRNVAHFVIAGLDPAIHLLRKTSLRRLMDARIKSGHDISFVTHFPISPRIQVSFPPNVPLRSGIFLREGLDRIGDLPVRPSMPMPARALAALERFDSATAD